MRDGPWSPHGPSAKKLGSAARNDAHDLATAPRPKLARTRRQREQRVVAAPADQVARVEVRAALAHDDLAGEDLLTAEALHTESLGVGVATVARARRTLFVCHLGRLLPARDAGYLDLGQRLPVTLALVVASLVLELVDQD